ncbi:MAG: hypothetical protein AAF993_06260 [Pseudomonadota bacterium]
MSAWLYRLINPPVRILLRSPLHGLMSQNTLLLDFTGRRSGRALSTPISYHVENQVAHCFTNRGYGWWRNLTNGQSVCVTIRGQRWRSEPVVEQADHDLMVRRLDRFLRAVPRDAAHAGVKLDANGIPDALDLRSVVSDMVYLQFPLEEAHG